MNNFSTSGTVKIGLQRGLAIGPCWSTWWHAGLASCIVPYHSELEALTSLALAAIVTQERSRVLSLQEEVVAFGRLSAIQFVPRCLIRLTFEDPMKKDRLVNQGLVILGNVKCSVTPQTSLTPWCDYSA